MFFQIAGHNIEIVGDTSRLRSLLPGCMPFETGEVSDTALLMRMRIEDGVSMIPPSQCHLIRDVDTGNGMTRVDRLSDGGYQFLIRDVGGNECALLLADRHFSNCRVALRGDSVLQRFALNNAMMLAFAFSAAYHDTLLIHASVVRHNGVAYAFTAKSGTGKSTQVANWLRYIENCDMINDDNPVIRLVDGKPILFGSPWSGKTPCYRNVQAPLGAVVLIERDDHNHVEPMEPITAFSTLLTACSAMKWDTELYSNLCDTVGAFVESGIKMVTLHCLPDGDSAVTCRNYLVK